MARNQNSQQRALAERSDGLATGSNKPEPETTIAQSSSISVLQKLLPFLSPYKKSAWLAFLFLLLAAGATLYTPVVLRGVVDQGFAPAIKSGDLSSLKQTLLLFAVVGLVMAGAAGARYTVVSWIGERVIGDLRKQVFAKLLGQPPVFFENLSTGEVLSRLTADTTLIQTLIGSSLSLGLRNLLLLIGSLVMLFVTNPEVTALVIGLISVVMGIVFLFTRRVRRLSRASQDRVADVSSHASEILNAMTTVQGHNRESSELARFSDRVEEAFNTGMRRTRIRAIALVVIMLAFIFSLLYGIWLGGQWVLEGKATFGELTQYAVYALMVGSSASVLAEVWGDLQRAAGASERLLEILNSGSEPEQSAVGTIVQPISTSDSINDLNRPLGIQFENIQFSYPSRPDRTVLRGFNLRVEPGTRVALVGLSGSGKTTVFALLQRFYETPFGQIKIFDQLEGGSKELAITALEKSRLRELIAIVPQEPIIFSTSAFENIRYGQPEATLEQVREAARIAAIDQFIMDLPNGYETFFGERGVRLSGGQKQRLAIARAVLRNSPILLLDEATSSLDAENEQHVQQALERAMQGRTSIVIAHRLATIRNCDVIHVVSEGQIIESGDHETLLTRAGRYSRLVELQGLK